MAAKASQFKLGLFVIVATALLLIALSLLGAGALFRKTYEFETYMTESVQGLEVGAPVKVRGVRVGTVSKIGFADGKYDLSGLSESDRIKFSGTILVEMKIDRSYFDNRNISTRGLKQRVEVGVEKGMRVTMASSGLTGPPYITIKLMNPTDFPPMKVPWTPDDLYIPSAPSTMTRFVTAAENILTSIEDANISLILTDLRKLLHDADQAVRDAQIGDISSEAQALLMELRETNQDLRGILSQPGIDKSISQAPQVLADTRRLMRRLDNLVTSQRGDIEAIIANLRRITENLEALSENAKDNPSQLIFGDPPPREDP